MNKDENDKLVERECINCGNAFRGDFCNKCGQRVIQRFNGIYLWQRLREDFIGIESGLFHTFKELWIHPGRMIRNYVKGATQQYYSPSKYLIIWTAAYLISVQLLNRTEQSPLQELLLHSNKLFSSQSLTDFTSFLIWFMSQKSDFYFLGLIPFLAVAGYFFFQDKNFNLTEIVIFLTYYLGQAIFCMTVVNLADLLPMWSETGLSFYVINILWYFLFFRMVRQFFNVSWMVSILKGGGMWLIGNVAYWSIIFLTFNGIKFFIRG